MAQILAIRPDIVVIVISLNPGLGDWECILFGNLVFSSRNDELAGVLSFSIIVDSGWMARVEGRDSGRYYSNLNWSS